MYRALAILLIILLSSACASTPPQNMHSQIEIRQQERAKEHLADLYKKKIRFFERQVLASAARHTDPQKLLKGRTTVASLNHSDCAAIAMGDWGQSVMYGQNFLEYANLVAAADRCFQR